MNRTGQPPQRPPSLGPTPNLGSGPFRTPYPPNYGMPQRNVNNLQSSFVPGLPPNNHRPGQQTPSQQSLLSAQSNSAFMQQQQQRTQSVFPFAGGLGQNQQLQMQGSLQQSSQQPQTQQSQQSQQQQQLSSNLQGSQQTHSQPNGTTNQLQNHLTTPSLGPSSVASASELGLDPKDFPALGSASGNNGSSSNGANGAGGTASYATQAGNGLSVGGPSLGSLTPNQTRDFTQDDFPALSGGATGQIQPSGPSSHQASSLTAQEGHSHPPGLNGFQHTDHSQQQQNRQGGLGSLGGSIQQQTPGMLNLGPAQARAIQGFHQHSQAETEKNQQQQQRNALNLKLNQTNAGQAAWNGPNINAGSQQSGAQQNGPISSQAQTSLPHQNSNTTGMNSVSATRTFVQQQQQGSQPQSNQIAGGLGFPSTNGITQQEPHTPNPVANPGMSQLQNAPDAAPGLGASVQTTQHPQTPAQQVLISAADRWGLLGLLAMIQNASLDVDQGLTTLGTDLGTMGLDMAYTGNLYSTFITPFSDQSAARTVEPDFHIPTCYTVSTPPAGPAKAATFNEETLLFMFYASPRDAMQEVAAQELFNRNWRFHKELRIWLTKDTSTATNKIPGGEQGCYIVWDPENWTRERKELTVVYTDLEDKSIPTFAHGQGLVPVNQANQEVSQQQQQPSPAVVNQRGSFAM